MPWTLFEYLYRDAGNFKAYGAVVLTGRIGETDREVILERLDSGEFFIAEQVGVPPLYKDLYRWSHGPTQSDHCWHEFVGFRETNARPERCACGSTAAHLVRQFASVSDWTFHSRLISM